jgi:hypothetical protein
VNGPPSRIGLISRRPGWFDLVEHLEQNSGSIFNPAAASVGASSLQSTIADAKILVASAALRAFYSVARIKSSTSALNRSAKLRLFAFFEGDRRLAQDG